MIRHTPLRCLWGLGALWWVHLGTLQGEKGFFHHLAAFGAVAAPQQSQQSLYSTAMAVKYHRVKTITYVCEC